MTVPAIPRSATTAPVALLLFAWLVAFAPVVHAADLLQSWNDGAARSRIVEFVAAVTDPAATSYVPPSRRIAVFDNDGTLWSEQPMYFQLAFMLERARELAPAHPEWNSTEPFKSALAGDVAGVMAGGEAGLVRLLTATHAHMSADEFERIARHWLATARHPRFHRPYTELAYQPMLELLRYLRANGFKTFIVSGGGAEFVRSFSESVYGIPPDQVVGSALRTQYRSDEHDAAIARLPEIEFVNDGPGKPVGIERDIGRRPILAFGNSDGDFEMLEYTTGGDGRRLALLLHHDDAEREVAYDRTSAVGKLDRALDAAPARGWTVVSMRRDWRTVFAPPAAGQQ